LRAESRTSADSYLDLDHLDHCRRASGYRRVPQRSIIVRMRRLMLVIFSMWFATSMTLADISVAAAQSSSTYPDSTYSSDSSSGYSPDQSESQALTDYLTRHKLPLVGAQVLRAPGGQRMVVLYGFVGSDFGKSDAVKKARRYLKSSSVRVDNHINVRPELLASNRSAGSAATNPGNSYSSTGEPSGSGDVPDEDGSPRSADDYASKYPGADSYAAQKPNATVQQLSSIAPMIALLGVLGMALAGSHSGFSFGGSSPFGSSPYGYGNPYSSPYGSPYGGSPYGGPPYGSPYGGSPYGGSPYGGSPYGSSPYGSGAYP
jgi:hypothetical protein